MHRIPKYLYVIGGCGLAAEREPISQIERIHVAESNEKGGAVRIVAENCGQLKTARRAPACFLTENRQILVAGGCLGPNNHTDSLEILNFDDNFQNSEILAEKLEVGASCSAFDPFSTSKFKPVFGGFETHSCLDNVQILDESATWKCRKLSGSPKNLPKIKNSCALEVENGEFLLFGGWEDEARTSKTIRRVIFNEDFTDFEVKFEGFLPYPVEGHSCVRRGSSVFLIGGFDGCFVIDTIVRYDLKTRKSEVLCEKLARKRENHVSAVLGDKYLVVAGGWDSRESLVDVEVFELLAEHKIQRRHVAGGGNLNFARNRPAGVPI